jgi:hypothetical protein
LKEDKDFLHFISFYSLGFSCGIIHMNLLTEIEKDRIGRVRLCGLNEGEDVCRYAIISF